QGITVIQRAVQRDAAGKALVLIVDEGKVLERSIELGSVQGNRWIVKNGLNAGDQVIVSGLQHVQPGSAVTVQEEGADALAQEQK
ncbi:efflux transporter periplasmic adaptor subunit, partial [Pseudomonas cichorii]|nr:efflux transporter periplasmic adaptor subunit [Pseudomonas cichorii]